GPRAGARVGANSPAAAPHGPARREDEVVLGDDAGPAAELEVAPLAPAAVVDVVAVVAAELHRAAGVEAHPRADEHVAVGVGVAADDPRRAGERDVARGDVVAGERLGARPPAADLGAPP